MLEGWAPRLQPAAAVRLVPLRAPKLLRSGAIHGPALGEPDATITLAKSTLDAVQLGETTLEDARASGDLKITGEGERLAQFLGLLENFPFWFGLVTP